MNLNDILETQNLGALDLQLVIMFVGASLLFSFYINIIYMFTTKSTFYSSAFSKTLMGMSIITTAIIIAMQGSLVVSLGMVGALSIVRFRNAVKAPLDLLFLFWAISTGIICGTGYFELALVTSVVMTIVVFGIDLIPVVRSSYILTINGGAKMDEKDILKSIKSMSSSVRVRTRNVTKKEQELLIELKVKKNKNKELVDAVKECNNVNSVSLIFFDGEVRY